jgi:hypothetical protein
MTPTADGATPNGWEVHRREQILRTTAATPLQRLRWLEDAIAFAFRAGALPRSASPGGKGSGSPGGTDLSGRVR